MLGAGSGALTATLVDDSPNGAAPTAAAAAPVSDNTSEAGNLVKPVLDAVEPSVVTIETLGTARGPFGRTVQTQAAGTGMIVSEDGRIVTNAHVVEGATRVNVTLSDGSTYEAEVVGADSSIDVAVLQIVDDVSDLPTVEFADSDTVEVGETVVAIGNALALGDEPTVTVGIVSALARSIDTGTTTMEDLVQTDAAINPGNSGGPLVDMDGRVVGMNTAVVGDAQNIGFAVSVDTIQQALIELTA
jgi:S1-C subfamily serine protease